MDCADNLFGKQFMSRAGLCFSRGSCLWITVDTEMRGTMQLLFYIVTYQLGAQLYVLRRPVALVLNLHWGQKVFNIHCAL